MADIHRTPQDVYALVIPQQPLEGEYNQGDDVALQRAERVDRLEQHGWVRNVEEDGHDFQAELTHTGAAILNYWQEHERDVMELLEDGVGIFVEEALSHATSHEDVEEWDIVEMTDGYLVIAGETPDGVRIERRYMLQSESEQHPQVA